MYIVTKVRNEHLSDEEIRKREEKQKKMKEKMNQHQSNHMKKSKSKQLAAAAAGGTSEGGEVAAGSADLDDVNLDDDTADLDDFDEFMIEHRPSLPRPPKTNVSWSEYITADEARWPTLGRKTRCKETRKEFKAQLAMVRFLLFIYILFIF